MDIENEEVVEKSNEEGVIESIDDGDEVVDVVDTPEVTDPPEEESIVVSIGDEPLPEEEKVAPEWVRDLRKKNREDQKRIRDLEDQLKAKEQPPAVVLGKKPSLADFDYDTDRFEAELEKWHEQKRKVDAEQESKQRSEAEQTASWNKKLADYNEGKTKIKVPDYEDAEAAVMDTFDKTQQGIIVHGAENPALLVYGLGKNHAKLKELALIKDPIAFAFAAAKLETQLKVNKRNAPPPPEKTVKGNATGAVINNQLEKLREEAAKTGDFSKVMQYKRQNKAK